MQLDLEYLRRLYASLSDDAILAVDRAGLTEDARNVLDSEINCRNLKAARAGDPSTDNDPDWLADGAVVFSVQAHSDGHSAPEAAAARHALEAAGIPCHLDVDEKEEEPAPPSAPTFEWRLSVPGNLSLHAASVLDRDIFNQEFEDSWKAHLANLTDDELRTMTPQQAFCGLFDRIERITRAYDEEVARRGDAIA